MQRPLNNNLFSKTYHAAPYSAGEIGKYISDIRSLFNEQMDTINDQIALDLIEQHVFSCEKSHTCSFRDNFALVRRVFLSLRSEMDILQPYVDDPDISEIMVNGKDMVFAERNGLIQRLPVSFDSTESLEELIRRIAARVHREINELNPIVDARLSDGSRVNAVFSNIALGGPILTIRKFPAKVMTLKDLLENGTVSAGLAQMLETLVKAGYNCFVSGGTSSGKTTLLNVLTQLIPPDERVIVIEDSAELQIRQLKNVVRLECRNANVQGKGEISMAALVKNSLRMRPDRIIIGEVRGAEVFDMINALNTGHAGSLSTGHAGSIEGMLKRLESMYLQAADFPVQAIRSQITEAIDIIIHMSRLHDGSRRILEIAELADVKDGVIQTNTLFRLGTGMTGHKLLHREKLEGAVCDAGLLDL